MAKDTLTSLRAERDNARAEAELHANENARLERQLEVFHANNTSESKLISEVLILRRRVKDLELKLANRQNGAG